MNDDSHRKQHDCLVSVVIPVYNIELYISRCVQSVVNQTYGCIEILLIDDGSTDNSGTICDQWSTRDKRIKVIHQINGGLSAARNTGIDTANGDYIAFIDGDDYIEPTMIERLVSRSLEVNADMVLTGFTWVDGEGKEIQTEQYDECVWGQTEFWNAMYPTDGYPEGVQSGYFVVAWNKLYKRDLFRVNRYDVGKLHEDEYILHRVIDVCESIATLSGSYYNYVQRDGSIVHQENGRSLLDAADAVLTRSVYLKEKGCLSGQAKSLGDCAVLMSKVSRCALSESDMERYNSISNSLTCEIATVDSKTIGRKLKLKYALYVHAPWALNLLLRLNEARH